MNNLAVVAGGETGALLGVNVAMHADITAISRYFPETGRTITQLQRSTRDDADMQGKTVGYVEESGLALDDYSSLCGIPEMHATEEDVDEYRAERDRRPVRLGKNRRTVEFNRATI